MGRWGDGEDNRDNRDNRDNLNYRGPSHVEKDKGYDFLRIQRALGH
jgi:hypothetical protein